jgi:hypothetical protein
MRKRTQFEKGVKFTRIAIRSLSIAVAFVVLSNISERHEAYEKSWIIGSNDCFAAVADFVPLYRLASLTDSTDTTMYMTHGPSQTRDTDPTLGYFKSSYMNVSLRIRWLVYAYLALNFWCVAITLITLFRNFRTSTLLKYMKMTDDFSPVLLAVLGLYCLHFRYMFQARVCLCDFEADFFRNREGWAWASSGKYVNHVTNAMYLCGATTRNWFNVLIGYELVMSGLHFITIVYHYFTNVLQISIKKSNTE